MLRQEDRAKAQPAPFAFDGIAPGFDRRAGLPAPAVEAIALALLELAGPGGGGLFEIGAGTGEIGLRLAQAAPGAYLGIDVSPPMLELARARFREAGAQGALALADGNARWPLGDGAARLMFLSRAAHLLSARHLADEALRLAHPEGACLALSRVRRGEGSLRDALRREMRRLLSAIGVEGRRGEDSQRRLMEFLAERGGKALPPRIVATWAVTEVPAEAIQAWREKPGLAGVALPDGQKHAILDQLEASARERYGDLNAGRTAEEGYELAAVALPPFQITGP